MNEFLFFWMTEVQFVLLYLTVFFALMMLLSVVRWQFRRRTTIEDLKQRVVGELSRDRVRDKRRPVWSRVDEPHNAGGESGSDTEQPHLTSVVLESSSIVAADTSFPEQANTEAASS